MVYLRCTKEYPKIETYISIVIPIVLISMSDRVCLTTHMITGLNPRWLQSVHMHPGRAGMIHYTVKSSLY